jgi:hypothetical protein
LLRNSNDYDAYHGRCDAEELDDYMTTAMDDGR